MSGELGPLFINIVTQPGLRDRETGDFTRALLDAIDQIGASSGQRGVVWFPPGVYRISTGWTIASFVTLSFSPGALLVPIAPAASRDSLVPADPVLRIAGPIEADTFSIFATRETWDAPLPRPDLPALSLGRVAMTGRTITRVLPEWWGAEGDSTASDPRVDTEAIAAALQSLVDREALTAEAPVNALEVFFGGTYALDRDIAVPDGLKALILRGIAPAGGPPTFRAVASTFTALRTSMFHLRRVRSIALTGLSFDASGVSTACLRLDVSLLTDAHNHEVTIERCSWANGLLGQVFIHDDSDAAPAAGSLAVRVLQCSFAGLASRFLPRVRPQQDAAPDADPRDLGPTSHVALSFSAPFASRLRVDRCVFSGFAMRAIRTSGGQIEVTACRFSVDESPGVFLKLATDIELRPPSAADAPYGALDAMACDSDSPTFLRVVPRSEGGQFAGGQGSVVLSCVKHIWALAFSSTVSAPAVIWEDLPDGVGASPQTPDLGGRLTTVGCSFEERYANSVRDSPLRDALGVQIAPIMRVFLSRFATMVQDAGSFRVAGALSDYMTFDRARPLSAYPHLLAYGGIALGLPIAFRLPDGALSVEARRSLWWATWIP